MIFLTEKYDNTNLIEYASTKSMRVIRYILKKAKFALAGACDASIIQYDPKHILRKLLKTYLNRQYDNIQFYHQKRKYNGKDINDRH